MLEQYIVGGTLAGDDSLSRPGVSPWAKAHGTDAMRQQGT